MKVTRAARCVYCIFVFSGGVNLMCCQQTAQGPASKSTADEQALGLPSIPSPSSDGRPEALRRTAANYARPAVMYPNPFAPYAPRIVEAPRQTNTPRLKNLLRDGKISLSLAEAINLAIANNTDIAIARYNLDIADTDVLRARSGASLRGVSTGIVANTLGGDSPTVTGGGGPGGTSVGPGGSAAGASGLVLSTNGGGTMTESLDPTLNGVLQRERATTPSSSSFLSGTRVIDQNTNLYNFGYSQNFVTGSALSVTFNNERVSTNSERTLYSPLLQSYMQVRLQQHLLKGFGPAVNGRFMIQAENDRKITNASFEEQVLYTINQIEDIYWALVSSWEDVKAKERSLDQSKQLVADNQKQFDVGTLAHLDVLNAESQVASDEQALVSSRNNLEYQQLLMKQAIVRDLDDTALADAIIIPSDRVDVTQTAEETLSVDDLVRQTYARSPAVSQAALVLHNDELTLNAMKNGMLPTVDLYGSYAANALGGRQNSRLNCGSTSGTFVPCPADTVSGAGYGKTFEGLFNGSGPDKLVGVSITIPLRNRAAQADQARSQLEYRQAQLRLKQIYTQIRIQILNGRYAVSNDRAAVGSAQSARVYAQEALNDELKRFRLGDSTTADVLQAQRNLAVAENNLISATAVYARDRSALFQSTASTLDHYGMSLPRVANEDAEVSAAVPGITQNQE